MTVTCAAPGCPLAGHTFEVPDDGFPVTCGGCNAIVAAAAR